MNKTYLTLAISLLLAFTTNAQVTLSNKGAKMGLYNAKLKVYGDIHMRQNAEFNCQGTVDLTGDWLNNSGSKCLTVNSDGTVIFSGAKAQTIGGSDTTRFFKLTFANSGSYILFAANGEVNDTLTFVEGLVYTGDENMLIFNDGSAAIGMTDSGFVAGPVIKRGNDSFTFPVGKTGNYQPLTISAPSDVTDMIKAEYYNFGQYLGDSLDPSLSYLSSCEFWQLDTLTDSVNVQVTLGWDAYSCDVASPVNDRVAQWQDSVWADLGNGATTGNDSAGTVKTNVLSDGHGYFALANEVDSTKLNPTWCGSTGVEISDTLVAVTVAGATSYEFRVMKDSTFDSRYTWTGSSGKLPLTELDDIEYNKTYKILVRAIYNKQRGPWGDTCSFSTTSTIPLTKLQGDWCDTTDLTLGDTLRADVVPGASIYEFVVWNDIEQLQDTVTMNNKEGWLYLLVMDSLRYGKTYDVTVRAIIGADTTAWGDSCSFSLKAHPATKVTAAWCGATGKSIADTVPADIVYGATYYNFAIEKSGGGYNDTVTTAVNELLLDDADDLEYGTTYNITARTVVGPDTSAWGTSCSVTLGAQPLTAIDTIFCDSTGMRLSDTITTQLVAGAKAYQYQVESTTGSYYKIHTRDTSDGVLLLSEVDSIEYGLTYNISVRTVVGNDTSTWGDTCQVGVLDSIPVTALRDEDCGHINLLMGDSIYADLVDGADAYEFNVLNTAESFNKSHYRDTTDGKLYLDSISGLEYGKRYDVLVRTFFGNDTSDWGDTCQIQMLQLTKLDTPYCDTSGVTLSDTLFADTISGVNGYKFLVEHPSSQLSTTYVTDSADGRLVLSETPGLEYDKTYNVLVAVIVNGDTSKYGDTCTFTTVSHPVTKLQDTWCDSSDISLADTLVAEVVVGAQAYIFNLEDTVSHDKFTYIREKQDGKLMLSEIRGLEYGNTYSVYIQTAIGLTTGPSGDTCHITLISHPTTKITDTWCDSSDVSMSDTVEAITVYGAKNYEFLVEKDSTLSFTYFSEDGRLPLEDVYGMVYDSTYDISIRTFVGSDTSAWGDTCSITLGGHPATKLQVVYCDSAGFTLNDTIYAVHVPKAEIYEFFVEDTATGATFVDSVIRDNNSLPLYWVDSLEYAATYAVSVRTIIGEDTSAWGDTCHVTLIDSIPVTTLRDEFISATGVNMQTRLFAKKVHGAQAYEFLVENSGLSLSETYYRDNTDGKLILEEIDGLRYGNTYDILVRSMVGNDTSAWGDTANVALLDTVPVTTLRHEDCAAMGVATDDTLFADTIAGGTKYRFLVENTADAFSKSYLRESSDGRLLLANITGLQGGTAYTVKVRTWVGADSSDYGNACTITMAKDMTEEDVSWAASTGVSVVGNDLSKTAADGWGNAGTASEQAIQSGSDGWVTFKVTDSTDNYVVGLSESSADDHYNTIGYGLGIDNGQVSVYFGGESKGVFGSVNNNDVFKLERRGDVINYYQNSTIIHFESANLYRDLVVDVSVYNNGADITDLKGNFSPALIDPVCDQDMNWSHVRVFDGTGEGASDLVGESRTYYDHTGKPMQVQVKNLTEDMVLAAEPMYDELGRQVGQTLPAPLNSSQICYRPGFFLNEDNAHYTHTDFDQTKTNSNLPGELNNPRIAGNTKKGTLGHYYSDNNDYTSHEFIAASGFPYSRIEIDEELGYGKRVSGPGEQLRMGQGHEAYNFSLPVAGELHYLFGLNKGWLTGNGFQVDFDQAGQAQADRELPAHKINKMVSRDQNGKEQVSFVDIDGKPVASCLSGRVDGQNVQEQLVSTVISKSFNYLDIHLPDGCEGSLKLSQPGTGAITYNLLDLITGDLVKLNGSYDYTGKAPVVDAGFYRIIVKSNTGNTEAQVSYKLNYHNFTLNLYDHAGNVKAVIPPNGIDKEYIPADRYTVGSGYANFQLHTNDFSFNEADINDKDVEVDVTLPSGTEAYITDISVAINERILPDNVSSRFDEEAVAASSVNFRMTGGISELSEDYIPPQFNVPYNSEGVIDVNDLLLGYEEFLITWDLKAVENSGSGPVTVTLESGLTFFAQRLTDDDGDVQWRLSSPYNTQKKWDVNGTNLEQVIAEVTDVKRVKCRDLLEPCDADDYTYLDKLSFEIRTETHAVPTAPSHTQATEYTYNSLGWLLSDQSVDEGKTEYVYRKDGQVRFVQDAKQRTEDKFTYFVYDKAGKVIEEGVYTTNLSNGYYFQNHAGDYSAPANCTTCTAVTNASVLEGGDVFPDADCTEESYMLYDIADTDFDTETGLSTTTYKQRFMLGKVSKTWNDEAKTWYSYDAQGRVIWTVKRIEGMTDDGTGYAVKTINYKYDFNGNVTEVIYQDEDDNVDGEGFDHLYSYDKDLRLKKVEVRKWTDGEFGTPEEHIQEQAEYFYYLDGRLRRTELAEDVQGMDYTYTIFGALKSINHATMDAQKDPGQDGYGASAFEEDAFAMALDYFSGDYSRAGTYINSGIDRRQGEYYNGLVKSERWQINHANAAPTSGKQWMYNYTYEEHNWLTSAIFGEYDPANAINQPTGGGSGDWMPVFTADSKEQYKVWNLTYDDNGNLQTLNRNMNERLVFGNTQVKMDEFTYRYKSGTNQLVHLNDNVTTSSFETDLKDQGTWDEETPANWNYEYDELGRMTANHSFSEPRYFEYDAAGLVTAVYDHSLKTDEDLLAKFVYDANGMRVKKTDYNSGSTPLKHTWYIRDAVGTVLAVYEQEDPTGVGTVEIAEKHIYGSDRIGQYNMIGKYLYELTDHRGNVRAVVSHNGVDLVWESYQDYYPFGSEIWGTAHSFNAGTYRYAYQGQEKDGETGYEAFQLRQWDGRLGRWMSVDPYQEFASPYLGMGNNPVSMIDPDGGSIFGGGGHDINWARRIGGGSNWTRAASMAGTVLSATASAAMGTSGPGPIRKFLEMFKSEQRLKAEQWIRIKEAQGYTAWIVGRGKNEKRRKYITVGWGSPGDTRVLIPGHYEEKTFVGKERGRGAVLGVDYDAGDNRRFVLMGYQMGKYDKFTSTGRERKKNVTWEHTKLIIRRKQRAEKYNEKRGLKEGDPGYKDPDNVRRTFFRFFFFITKKR